MFATQLLKRDVGAGTSRGCVNGSVLMFFDDARPHSSDSDTPESGIRFAMVLAELWHDGFEAMSEVAYQTHRACEFFVQNGGSLKGQYARFNFRDFREPFDFRAPRSEYEGPNGSIDVDKLKECLQSMDSMQAARVMHAVQMMQAMEAMLKRRRSRANQAEGAPW
jgi:hypothetical protein